MKENKKISQVKKFKVSNLLFSLAFALIIATGIVFCILAPIDVNEYENRTAEKVKPLTFGSFSDGTFQDSIEAALADQLPFAIELRHQYNVLFSKLESSSLEYAVSKGGQANNKQPDNPVLPPDDDPVDPEDTPKYSIDVASLTKKELQELESFDMPLEQIYPVPVFDSDARYNKIGGYYVYKDHLMFGVSSFGSGTKSNLERFAVRAEELAELHPDVGFYSLYIEKETDMNFLTGYRPEIGKYLYEVLQYPDDHKAMYTLHSFDEYDNEFYRTDHHWNHRGSYRGYKLALKMLLPDEAPYEPLREVHIGKAGGSKTMTKATASYVEQIYAYEFDFPDFKYYINGRESENYGKMKTHIEKVDSGYLYPQISYASMYGSDYADVTIDRVEDTGNGNILVIGTSYDNAILIPLASHYDCLHCIDLRHYANTYGKEFSMSEYIEKNNIGTVLFVGDVAFYKGNEFVPGY